MGINTGSLQNSIKWPAGTFKEYKSYTDHIQIVLSLDYTTWEPTLKVYFKDPCNPSNTLSLYVSQSNNNRICDFRDNKFIYQERQVQ